MTTNKICLASDNWSSAHPLVIKALIEANEDYAPSYGSDRWTEKAHELIEKAFQTKCKVFILPTGTGANVFGLMLCCRRHESVICTDIAHIQYQESGAFESIVGGKLLTVPHQNGKVTSPDILKKLRNERAFGKHSTSPRVLSIAQPTEVGTIYSLQELKSLAKLCQEENLLFHIDGSRLYNAVASQKIDLSEIVSITSLDILSLGGTKNGLIGAEALLVFNPSLQDGSDFLQKQTLQLLSKMRYVSAQFIPFFKDELWRTLALHANQKAKEIASIIEATPQCSLSYPAETNQIFFTTPPTWIAKIQEEIFCLLWDREKNEIRFIASWSTTDQDVEGVRALFTRLSK
jgi:threonine aldolase